MAKIIFNGRGLSKSFFNKKGRRDMSHTIQKNPKKENPNSKSGNIKTV